MNDLIIIPITYKQASDFVNMYHRHHSASQGCKFCIGLQDNNNNLVGVAMCGRPVSRVLDDGFTLEINRICTLGQKNACSMLYGACCRIAKNMGYKKVITYLLESENGASVKASNFVFDGFCGGLYWSNRNHCDIIINSLFGDIIVKKQPPQEKKTRWVRFL